MFSPAVAIASVSGADEPAGAGSHLPRPRARLHPRQPAHQDYFPTHALLDFFYDVTEQVLAHQQVEQLNQELETRVQERNREALALQADLLAAPSAGRRSGSSSTRFLPRPRRPSACSVAPSTATNT